MIHPCMQRVVLTHKIGEDIDSERVVETRDLSDLITSRGTCARREPLCEICTRKKVGYQGADECLEANQSSAVRVIAVWYVPGS